MMKQECNIKRKLSKGVSLAMMAEQEFKDGEILHPNERAEQLIETIDRPQLLEKLEDAVMQGSAQRLPPLPISKEAGAAVQAAASQPGTE